VKQKTGRVEKNGGRRFLGGIDPPRAKRTCSDFLPGKFILPNLLIGMVEPDIGSFEERSIATASEAEAPGEQ